MKKGPKSARKFFSDSFQFLAESCVLQPPLCIKKPLCEAVLRVLAGSCTQNSTPFHIFSFFMKTHNRPYQPVERADGRSLANRPAFVRVCHGHQFFYRQGHQSGAPEPGSAHYLRHQNTPGTGAFRISGKDGQTNQSELLLSRKPRRKAGFSQFRRFLIY